MSDEYYACPVCGCTDVETQTWVKTNTNEPTDCVDNEEYFCPRCEGVGDAQLDTTDKLDPYYLEQHTEPHDAREHGAQADARAQAMGWDDKD